MKTHSRKKVRRACFCSIKSGVNTDPRNTSYVIATSGTACTAGIPLSFSFQDTGELLATLLPHIQKAVADAGISVELVEIVERKAAAQTPRDDDLDGILGHMSLSNLLSFIIARDEGFRIPLREKVEGILAFDDTRLIHV